MTTAWITPSLRQHRYALFALVVCFSTGSPAAEAVTEATLKCRSKKPPELATVTAQDVRALARSGVVPARLTKHLSIGAVGQPTLWWGFRRTGDQREIPRGFVAERYEERTLEVFGANLTATALEQLIDAVAHEKKFPGVNAVMVSASTVRGVLNLSAALPNSTSLRLGFVDSSLGDLILKSPNMLGSGIHFEREVSLQCVQAKTINLQHATFSRPMTLNDVRAEAIEAANATFQRGAEFHSVSAKSLDLQEAKFSGGVGLRLMQIHADVLDLERARISRGELLDLAIRDRLSLKDAVVDGSLDVMHSVLGLAGGKEWLADTYAPFTLQNASFGSLRLSNVELPQGIDLDGVHADSILVKLSPMTPPLKKSDSEREKSIEKTASHSGDTQSDLAQRPQDLKPECHPASPRVSLRGAQVDGWLEIHGTAPLGLDLTNSRATYLDVRAMIPTKTAAQGKTLRGCLSVAGLKAPTQFWADPFPFDLDRLTDMRWRGDLNAFRAQLERQAGKSRADAWYREAREANSSGPFDRRIRGDLLAYGMKPVPPLLVAIVLVLTLFVAFISWRSDALDIPERSFWTTRFGRPLAHLLFAVRTLTPFGILDVKTRPGVHWHGAPLELIAVIAKVMGLTLLGGLLIAWTGYI